MSRFMKFYPSDWRAEPRLRLMSRAARSLWLDMIGLMHDAGTKRLEVKGRPMTEQELADALGDKTRAICALLAEIESAGVSGRDGMVCAYCGATDGRFDLDHIYPWSRGGSDTPENLTVACAPCNRTKGARTPEEMGWRHG